MLEAKGNAADLQQFAQAIASAVRPAIVQQVVTPPLIASASATTPTQGTLFDTDGSAAVETGTDGATILPVPPRKPNGGSTKRRLPTPNILELDLTSGDVPFAAYYQEKKPDDHTKRYLVIAAWFKEYRKIDEINDDHIYTCYRTLNLNTVADIGGVFRGCKKQGWFNSGSKRGWYTINHVGLNQVNNLGRGE